MLDREAISALRDGLAPTVDQRLAAIYALLNSAVEVSTEHCLVFGADPWDLTREGATRAAAAAAQAWLAALAKRLVEQGFDFAVVDELALAQVSDEQCKQLG